MQFNGVQLNTTGLDMRTQFMDQGINNLPNPDSPEVNSLPNNPLYNLLQVLFQGKQTDNISRYNGNDLFSHQNNGLKPDIDTDGHDLITYA
jgi:hypothetical protein